ncbi:hypothetical protein D3C87_1541850 [compost metagenome]
MVPDKLKAGSTEPSAFKHTIPGAGLPLYEVKVPMTTILSPSIIAASIIIPLAPSFLIIYVESNDPSARKRMTCLASVTMVRLLSRDE